MSLKLLSEFDMLNIVYFLDNSTRLKMLQLSKKTNKLSKYFLICISKEKQIIISKNMIYKHLLEFDDFDYITETLLKLGKFKIFNFKYNYCDEEELNKYKNKIIINFKKINVESNLLCKTTYLGSNFGRIKYIINIPLINKNNFIW